MQAWHCGPPVSYGGRHGQGEVGPGISLTTSSLASSPASLAMSTSPVCQQPVACRRVPCRQLSWTSVEITSGMWPISSMESGLSSGHDDARLRKGDDISQPLAGNLIGNA
ncbi:hypothetical protein OsJ_24734 [Oryza sativa Japonica Group]|uniref:Uncharacterized protein n=1 Tax=Oryza sativa subsp. japonica TaxID=39947 RepID=B9FXX2_ORYSJ|nr:hypothetical protein OsJ_24734 [Oryza sativa Japonica Group]